MTGAKGWRRFAGELQSKACASPRLWLIPAAAVAASHLVHMVLPRGLASGFINSVLFSLANAVFCEAWVSDGRRPDADRLFETLILFLAPLPVLAAFAALAQFAIAGTLSGGGYGSAMAAIRTEELSLGAFSFSAIVVCALSVRRLSASSGAFDALPHGIRLFAANIAPLLVLLAAAGLVQYGASWAWSAWRASAAGAPPGLVESLLLVRIYLLTAATMFGAVAAPAEALRAGLLEEP